MKSKKDIKKLANQIFNLQLKLQKATQDKEIKSLMRQIEIIMESLSLKEGLELNDTVMELFKNNLK